MESDPMKQKVLITGNSGVLGINLVDYLHKHYSDDYELVLFDIQHPAEHVAVFTTITGDIRDKNKVQEIIKDIDIVLHCASASPASRMRKYWTLLLTAQIIY